MERLNIYLFGQPRIYRGESRLTDLPPRKDLHLLCYLALHRRRSHARGALAGLFWADSPEEQARRSLRTSLWRLRNFLGRGAIDRRAYLFADKDDVCFDACGECWVDVAAFEGVAAAGVSERAAIEALAAAVALYQGDLLEGCDDDWCLIERERLRGLFLGLLSTLLRQHRDRGEYDEAIRYGRQLVAHDPLLEHVHRELIVLYCLIGDRGAALRQYRRCRETLRAELDVEPSEELQELHAQLAGRRERHSPGRGTSAAPAAPARATGAESPRAGPSLESRMEAILGRLQTLEGEFQRNVASLEATRRRLDRLGGALARRPEAPPERHEAAGSCL